jgi:hypothetical protein
MTAGKWPERRAVGDLYDQGRYLDVFEKRDGEWKILHRVMSNDFDRWIETIDVAALVSAAAPQNASLRGCRGTDDPSYRGFDLLEHRPERPAMKDLWGPFAALAEASSG